MIGISGERGSGISVLAVLHDDEERELKSLKSKSLNIAENHCCDIIRFRGYKKGVSCYFDTPMGDYDEMKICGLLGCLLLYNLNNVIDP